jgi:ABC-type branched-subunit amino acid transport system ATPase component
MLRTRGCHRRWPPDRRRADGDANITLRFGGVVAIKDISFDIREGEIRAIIGPNGAGKSSMLNVISGFYHPQEGEVWLQGRQAPADAPLSGAPGRASRGPSRTSRCSRG